MDMAYNKTALSTFQLPPSVVAVRRIGDGFKAFQVLRAGFDSGLFDWLERHGPAEKSAIADALKLRGAHLGGFLGYHPGTTLINGSLDGLLRLLRQGAEAAVIGPTATLIFEPYARRGVTVIGGTRVLVPDELLDLLAEGGSGYHFFGKTVERVTLRLPGAA